MYKRGLSPIVSFLVYPDIVHLHGDGEGGFIDAFLAAPVASPGQVEDDVEGVVEGPLVVGVAQDGLFKVEQLLAVDVGYDFVIGPQEGVDVEIALGFLYGDGLGLVGLVGVVVGLGVDG